MALAFASAVRAVALPPPVRRAGGGGTIAAMPIAIGPDLAAAFMLVFARVGTLVMLLPAIGERMLPVRLRLGLALFLTLALLPFARPMLPAPPLRPETVIGALAIELGIGLMIGLAGRIVVASLQTAGNFVAQALGLAFAESVDPTQGGQAAALGNFLTLLGITLLFVTDAHHTVIAAIAGSYKVLPPGTMPSTGDAAALALTTLAGGFSIAVQLAGPFIVFAIVFNLGLGVLSRLMPSLQVFFLGMPATILVGFVLLGSVLGLMMGVFLAQVSGFLHPFAMR